MQQLKRSLYIRIFCWVLLLRLMPFTLSVKFNCFQMPYKELNSCCKFPKYRYESYVGQCTQVSNQSNLFDLTRYMHPCVFACVASKQNLIDANNNLNMPRIRRTLKDFLKDERFVSVYYNGIIACGPSIRSKIARNNKRNGKKQNSSSPQQERRDNCSNVALLYAVCAHTEAFTHCPHGAWSATAPCNSTREFVKACIQKN